MNERLTSVLSKLPTALQSSAELQRDYRNAQVEKRRKNWETWRAKNPEVAKRHHEASRLKRAQEFAAACAELSPEQFAAVELLVELWRIASVWQCAYCGKSVPTKRRTVDHVVPLSKGGKHVPENIVPSCRPCNSRKAARPYYYA
jgi:5-methylcytosine-specific restriction endonuclease McrA